MIVVVQPEGGDVPLLYFARRATVICIPTPNVLCGHGGVADLLKRDGKAVVAVSHSRTFSIFTAAFTRYSMGMDDSIPSLLSSRYLVKGQKTAMTSYMQP